MYRPRKSTLMILSGLLVLAALIALTAGLGDRLIAALTVTSVGCALWGCATEDKQ